MKKNIAQRLNKIAEALPCVMREYNDQVLTQGKFLNLSPLKNPDADNGKWEKDKWYTIDIPKFVAWDHHKQLKDAYARGGWPAVDVYGLDVLECAGALKGVDVEKLMYDKNKINLDHKK